MAEVTLRFDELEDGDLPLVCMECGSRRHVDLVERTFVRRPLFAPGLIGMALTKRVRAAVPLCEAHGGPKLFGYQGRSWWGLQTVAVGQDRLTVGRVHEDFAEALRKRREKRRRGEGEEVEPARRRRVQTGRGPGGGMAAFKILGIILAVMAGSVVLLTCGMCGFMGLMTFMLPKGPRPAASGPAVPMTTGHNEEVRPQSVVVGLLAAAPTAGFPGAVPWAPLTQSAQKETFHIPEDAELDKLLAELNSHNPGDVEQAAKHLTQATPDEARRQEIADALKAALANPFPMAKEAAAEALGKWGTADDAPALNPMLADPFPSSRAAACGALKYIGTKANLPALEKLVRDRAPEVAQAAAEAVRAIKARG